MENKNSLSTEGFSPLKILFVSALSAELKIVKQEIKKLNISKNIEISFFESGMGNYKTIMNLGLFLVEQKFLGVPRGYDFIVNIGVCGWTNYNPSPSPLPFSQKEGGEKLIQISAIKNISNKKELISPVFLEFAKIKSIACSEKIIYNSKKLEGEKFVDMESYGFEMIGNKFDVPRIILKVPVDKIGEETKNFNFEKAKKYLADNINYAELLEKIENFLSNNNKNFTEKENILKNKIINNYKWTFSEKIILEKLLNKFIVLELGNLEEFFEENKNISKKEFLNKLKIKG